MREEFDTILISLDLSVRPIRSIAPVVTDSTRNDLFPTSGEISDRLGRPTRKSITATSLGWDDRKDGC
jgi:hypothetical protein